MVCSKKSPTGPTERTPKPEDSIARLQLRGPLGFGPIAFLMDMSRIWIFKMFDLRLVDMTLFMDDMKDNSSKA